jgi:hypothetical protein
MPDNGTGRTPGTPVIEDDLETAAQLVDCLRARLPSATMHPTAKKCVNVGRTAPFTVMTIDRMLLDRMGGDSVSVCRPLVATEARSAFRAARTTGLPVSLIHERRTDFPLAFDH